MHVVAAIHGILTGQSDASWPDYFDAWMAKRDSAVHVIKKDYAAGPFPRINWIKNRRVSRGLAAELELFEGRGAEGRRDADNFISIVAHSNGSVIALETAALLIARGIKLDTLILTGSACEADVVRSGVLEWIYSGNLQKAISYSSRQDCVVPHPGESASLPRRLLQRIYGVLSWPYGSLGRTGWMRDGKEYWSTRVRTQWFQGGHSCYWELEQRPRTFETIYQHLMKL